MSNKTRNHKSIKVYRTRDDNRVIIVKGNKVTHVKCRRIGGYRDKYIGKDFVLKIDGSGGDQTETEIKKYKKISSYDKRFFPKFYSWSLDDGYVVQEKIIFKKRTTFEERNQAKKIIDRLCKRYRLYGDIDPSQMRNWKIRQDGRPVIFDFGI